MPNRLAHLVARIPLTAGNGDGIGAAEDRLATQIQRYSGQGVPLLLPLLKHSRFGVRQLTSYILRDIKGLNDFHLDTLIAADRRESGWLQPAIARIGTPRAIAYLAEELHRKPDADSQIAFAFEILGTKGIAALCCLLRSDTTKDDSLRNAIVTIFYRLEPVVKQWAVTPLLAILRVLPGAPEWAAIQNGGASLCVACLGGTIQVEPDGKIHFIG